jgi:hypothetical protein
MTIPRCSGGKGDEPPVANTLKALVETIERPCYRRLPDAEQNAVNGTPGLGMSRAERTGLNAAQCLILPALMAALRRGKIPAVPAG